MTTDIHETSQVAAGFAGSRLTADPAFLARQTDLLLAAGRSGRVNVKKGQFVAPWDMRNVVAKMEEAGNADLLLTERGSTFGYGNLVNDMRAIPWMQDLGRPVIFDATHSVQTPGSQGDRTGGDRRMVPYWHVRLLPLVAMACLSRRTRGRTPPPSDGPNMIVLDALPGLISQCLRIREAIAARPGETDR